MLTTLEDFIVAVFHIRDIRGGYGDRDAFHEMMDGLARRTPHIVVSLLDIIPEYGYWKDFFRLALNHPDLLETAYSISKTQLEADEAALAEGRQPSLFARWFPKEGKKLGAFTKGFANYLYRVSQAQAHPHMEFSQCMASLRRRIVRLNAALGTVETLECANRWSDIVPERVPVLSLKKQLAAFLNVELPLRNMDAPIRHPTNLARMICRERFTSFLADRPQSRKPEIRDMEGPRYDLVRERVRLHITA